VRLFFSTFVCCVAVTVGVACSGDDDAGIEPPAGYTEVASGESDGLTWTLSSQPDPDVDGGTCWHLDTEPEVEQLLSDTECRPPVDDELPRDFNSEFPFGTPATGAFDILVGIIPDEIAEAEFGFADGSAAEPVFVDEERGIIVWAGPSEPFLGGVAVTLADGVRLGCGPGDIVSSTQLEDMTEEQLVEIRQFVFTCLEAA